MSRAEKLLAKATNTPDGLRFEELKRLCESLGMVPRKAGGSHIVYTHPCCGDRPISIQKDKGGTAKGYQVKQVLKFKEDHNLKLKG